ncbi:hypothetical protein PGT21_016979 [Puccinia graminis f. sp. tritici]|uniref:Uncharacterized protein n=1 Tax=Puccinia graminis f. sp. tritici TaxID=56615 RepID=A0A5B0M3H8_PUCGR|nr:hypothetical protein PGT21_016979 [Puccinia graminis f. sp. tritici]KAA1125954.1 hypothetical protein PGTUg99_024603 [Puccinia graminis f. sp. tritici]
MFGGSANRPPLPVQFRRRTIPWSGLPNAQSASESVQPVFCSASRLARKITAPSQPVSESTTTDWLAGGLGFTSHLVLVQSPKIMSGRPGRAELLAAHYFVTKRKGAQ